MLEIQWFGVLTVPVIIALVKVLTDHVGMSKKAAPLAAVVIGVVGSFVAYQFGDNPMVENLFNGLLASLTAMGLYSGAKATTEGFKRDEDIYN